MRRFDEERRTYRTEDDWSEHERGRDPGRTGWSSGDRDEDRSMEQGRGRGREEGGYSGPYGGNGYPGYGREYGRGQSSLGRTEGKGERGGDWGGGREWRGRDWGSDRERQWGGGRDYGSREYRGRGFSSERDWGDEDRSRGWRDEDRDRGSERRVYSEERYGPEPGMMRGRGNDEDRVRGRSDRGGRQSGDWGGRHSGDWDRESGTLESGGWSGRESTYSDRDPGYGGRGEVGFGFERRDRDLPGFGGLSNREFEEGPGAWGIGQDQRREREGWRASERGPHKGRGPRTYTRSDERIRDDVNERLEDDDWLDASDIDVRSEGGVITLEGSVRNKEAKRRAEDLAESCRGVKDVMNRLRIDEEEGILERIGNALPG
jgi:hypothetical protein